VSDRRRSAPSGSSGSRPPGGAGGTGDERVVADFVANFVAGDGSGFAPVRGRVLMSDRRVLLVAETWRTVVPIGGIVDVSLGSVPQRVRELFDDALLVRYQQRPDADPETLVVGADTKTIRRFARLLYRATLDDATVAVASRVRVGGVHRERDWQQGALTVTPDHVRVAVPDAPAFDLPLADVVHVDTELRTVGSKTRRVLVVDHRVGDEGSVARSRLYCPDRRQATILSRVLKGRAREATNEGVRAGATDADLRVLLAVHALAPDATPEALATVFETDPEATRDLLDTAREKRLLIPTEATPTLTPAGLALLYAEVERTDGGLGDRR
jgi:helix-turn-helix protein